MALAGFEAVAEALAAGRFAEGFALYRAYQATPEYARASARQPGLGLFSPRWRGEDLAGRRLMIISEQGLGDQVMYARFVPLLQAAGAEVSWLCPGTLARLLSQGLGIRAMAAEGTIELTRPDFHMFSSELPLHVFPPLTAPPEPPYLKPPPAVAAEGAAAMGGSGRIGIAPSGNPGHPNDAHRSLTGEAFAQMLDWPGTISLLPQHTGAEDYYDTARIIAGLDLVIAVDSSVAHVAGAMGKPVWVLLPHIGLDWRWGDGVRSPWYPAARLFRQPAPHRWDAVVGQVRAALDELG